MLEGPEYASYIELCRELRLERKQAEPGDLAILWHDQQSGPYVFVGLRYGWCHPSGWFRGGLGLEPQDIWLPRLDQWLAMLETAGYASIEFCARAVDMETYLYGAHPDDMDRFTGWLPTREEAAGQLWMTVRQVSPAAAG